MTDIGRAPSGQAGRATPRAAKASRPSGDHPSRKRAEWRNGKRTVTGEWEYFWHSDRFRIVLDQRDRITGQNKVIITAGSQREKPEWGNWVLQEQLQ